MKGISSTAIYLSVYVNFYDSLCDFAASKLKNTEEGKDIASDVFVKLWELRNLFKTIGEMKSYAFIAVRNRCINFLIQKQRRGGKRGELVGWLYELTGCDINDVLKEPAEVALYQAIGDLDGRYRPFILYFYFENMSFGEIAKALGISEPTVRYRIETGRRLIRASLDILNKR